TFSAVPNGSPAATLPGGYSLNPYYAANGNCGSALASPQLNQVGVSGVNCRFNYAATVQDLPASSRDSLLARAALRVGADTTLWSELLLSRNRMLAQYAPAAQPLGVSPTDNAILYNRYITPYLSANNLSLVGQARLGFRAVALGGRADLYESDARHFALGVEGSVAGWDYHADLALSHSVLGDSAAGGFEDYKVFAAAVSSGAFDPVMNTGSAALDRGLLHTQFQQSVSDLNTLRLGAQREMFKMAGGAAVLGLGAEWSSSHYTIGYAPISLNNSGFSSQGTSSDFPIGGGSGLVPFDASRTNWGLFGELLLPITKRLEATASLRWDAYSKTHSNEVFASPANLDPVTGLQDQLPGADLGNRFSAATGRLSLRWRASRAWLLRGSLGTGFKAPGLADIANPLAYVGVTAGAYPCPFPGSPGCLPGSGSYDLMLGGNPASGSAGLKPESSTQLSLGLRFEPMPELSLGFDLWDVQIRNQVLSQGVAEQVAFADPRQYASLFVNPYQDPAGFTTIAFQQLPLNGGRANYQGLDWDVSGRWRAAIGEIGAHWSGTQMLVQRYNFGAGLPYKSDLGLYGPDQQVVFRTLMDLELSLRRGEFTHALTLHYRSGYRDQAYPVGSNVFLANPDGSAGASTAFGGLQVPATTTLDWQTRYDYDRALQLRLGLKNLLDAKPPLSLQTGGGGNQAGYDGRYYDPTGRLFYLAATYRF
ncbi:MAG: TonB-dependent receptor, partial [Burkholderiales bacterium]|nr:TonB-dependent receptor [Burkholderiales bacterium]